MPCLLDDAANFSDRSIEAYARACSSAVDEALEAWPVAEQTTNGRVSTGFLGDNQLRSVLWTQSFDTTTSAVSRDDLLAALNELFEGEQAIEHAPDWDDTFAGANVLGKLANNNDDLVHWKFDASPLSGRDMLYVIHPLREEAEATPASNNDWVLRITYAYASVSDQWAKQSLRGAAEPPTNTPPRVRALNTFPSCDRVTVHPDDRITLDHLMTTDIGGWVRPFCFNHLFKKALIQANAHECEKMRACALALCRSLSKNSANATGSTK